MLFIFLLFAILALLLVPAAFHNSKKIKEKEQREKDVLNELKELRKENRDLKNSK